MINWTAFLECLKFLGCLFLGITLFCVLTIIYKGIIMFLVPLPSSVAGILGIFLTLGTIMFLACVKWNEVFAWTKRRFGITSN